MFCPRLADPTRGSWSIDVTVPGAFVSARRCGSAAVATGPRGWPAKQIQPALLTLAADRETRSPMRVAEAGPWWDQPPPSPPELDGVDLAALEAELDDIPEQRPALQAKARDELASEHLPVTRATVTARAVQILHRSRQEVA